VCVGRSPFLETKAEFSEEHDGANQTGPWVAMSFFSLSTALVAITISQWFGGNDPLPDDEPIHDEPNWSSGKSGTNLYGQAQTSTQDAPEADDPNVYDDLNPDEIRHIESMRKKAIRQKNDILNTHVTGIAFVLIFLALGIAGVLKVIKG